MMRHPGQERARMLESRLSENLSRVRQRIADAAAAAGRSAAEIKLVAVTKKVPLEVVRALVALGQIDLGESRPENVPERARAMRAEGARVNWHLIGHYQRRKIESTLHHLEMVHSVHSLRLLAAIARVCADFPTAVGGRRPLPVLLQVNVSGEASKQGLSAREAEGALEHASMEHPEVSVQGFMTMAPLGLTKDGLRQVFARLRELRDGLRTTSRPLPHLSMGMSGDFEEAILEGATIVRVGTALFEGLELGGRPSPGS